MAYFKDTNIFQLRESSYIDTSDISTESQDRRMKFLNATDTEFRRGDDGIWIAFNDKKKIYMQISEQLFQKINNQNPKTRPVYALRTGSVKDDIKNLFDTEDRETKQKLKAIQEYGIKKDNIVRIKNEELAAQCKKENTHFKDEIDLLDRICNLIIIHDSIKVKQVLLSAGVVERLAPGDQEQITYIANNFKIFELEKTAPKKFEYKKVIFYLSNIPNDEVFRFEFEE